MSNIKPRSPASAGNANTIEVSGVLETIASGISMVLARPWLMLIPLAADLWAWLGTQVSGTPLITGMQRLMIEQGEPTVPLPQRSWSVSATTSGSMMSFPVSLLPSSRGYRTTPFLTS